MALPTPTFADLAYCEADPADTKGNLIDVYVAGDGGADPAPAIVWTSGSAWMADDGKHGAAALAEEFVPRGYVVVGLSIRSSAQTIFPGQLHDIRAAVRFVRRNAERFGVDPDRIAIMGTSSGGWAASIAATTSGFDELDGERDGAAESSAVHAAVSFFPPIDFTAMDAQTREQHATYGIDAEPVIVHDDPSSPESMLVGGPIQDVSDLAAAASPIAYVDGAEPPIALFHGTHDPLLPPGQSQVFFEALLAAGSSATLSLVEGSGHRIVPPAVDAPALPFDPGSPVIGADAYEMWSAIDGTRVSGEGTAPTWDAIDSFLRVALG